MKLFQPKQEEMRQYMATGQQAKADSLVRGIQTEIEAQFKDYTAHLIPAEKREVYKTMGGNAFSGRGIYRLRRSGGRSGHCR